jgi:hypothetical protein
MMVSREQLRIKKLERPAEFEDVRLFIILVGLVFGV